MEKYTGVRRVEAAPTEHTAGTSLKLRVRNADVRARWPMWHLVISEGETSSLDPDGPTPEGED